MGGPEPAQWLADLDASFEAALAREEEVAADDLAFSLRQDGDLRTSTRGQGWALLVHGEQSATVDEVGTDYVVAGRLVVPGARAVLRTGAGRPPASSERTFLEVLSSLCRAGTLVEVRAGGAGTSGRIVRVARDHLLLRRREGETVVGLEAVESVRPLAEAGGGDGYSVSRGFRG